MKVGQGEDEKDAIVIGSVYRVSIYGTEQSGFICSTQFGGCFDSICSLGSRTVLTCSKDKAKPQVGTENAHVVCAGP